MSRAQILVIVTVFFGCSHSLFRVTDRVEAFIIILRANAGSTVNDSFYEALDGMVEQYKNEIIPEASPLITPVTDINYVLYFREKLGEGIQSSVYRATYLQNGKDVAVKVEKRQMTKKEKENFMVRRSRSTDE